MMTSNATTVYQPDHCCHQLASHRYQYGLVVPRSSCCDCNHRCTILWMVIIVTIQGGELHALDKVELVFYSARVSILHQSVTITFISQVEFCERPLFIPYRLVNTQGVSPISGHLGNLL